MMGYSVRTGAGKHEDEAQLLGLRDMLFHKKVGSFSLASRLHDPNMRGCFSVFHDKDNGIAGYGLVWEQHPAPVRIVRLELAVHPYHQESGVEQLLFERMDAVIMQLKPKLVQARLFEEQTELLRFFESQGFAENHRMVKSFLPLPGAAALPYAASGGAYLITALAEEKRADPDCFAKLRALHYATIADYPRDTQLPPPVPNDDFLHHPDHIDEAYFIAKMGERYVGHSQLLTIPGDPKQLVQGYTAVLSEYRGRGIAKAMKACGIGFAVSRGYCGIHTSNRSTNAPMLAVNKSLGFVPYTSEIRLEKLYN